jgi:hypothetical protein
VNVKLPDRLSSLRANETEVVTNAKVARSERHRRRRATARSSPRRRASMKDMLPSVDEVVPLDALEHHSKCYGDHSFKKQWSEHKTNNSNHSRSGYNSSSGQYELKYPHHERTVLATVTCPWVSTDLRDFGCNNLGHNIHSSPKGGTKMVIFGTSLALSREGEWHYEKADRRLFYLPEEGSGFPFGADNQVVVPLLTTLVTVGAADEAIDAHLGRTPRAIIENITFNGLTFTDVDYTAATPETATGFQAPFYAYGNRFGFPSDAAVRIENAWNVQIRRCKFVKVGGGGMHVTRARDIEVVASQFLHMGQSGIVLSGNDTTQPTKVRVYDNIFYNIGSIMHGAGGMICSSCSDTEFIRNNISFTSRWGVHVRNNIMYPDVTRYVPNVISSGGSNCFNVPTKD